MRPARFFPEGRSVWRQKPAALPPAGIPYRRPGCHGRHPETGTSPQRAFSPAPLTDGAGRPFPPGRACRRTDIRRSLLPPESLLPSECGPLPTGRRLRSGPKPSHRLWKKNPPSRSKSAAGRSLCRKWSGHAASFRPAADIPGRIPGTWHIPAWKCAPCHREWLPGCCNGAHRPCS